MCEAGCNHSEIMVGVPYRNAVGCLIFLIIDTRTDLAATVGVLCQFTADPCLTHLQASTKKSTDICNVQGLIASSFKQQVILDCKDFWMQTGSGIRCHEEV